MDSSRGGTAVVSKALADSCSDRIEFTAIPSAVRQARHWAAAQLAQSDPPPTPAVIETAVLLVSELVTNAIRAACLHPDRGVRHPGPDQISLLITRLPMAIRIEVHDSAGGSLPPPADCSADSETGRGLTVIATLSRGWGWQAASGGKTVWCELSA
jgi:anti-sigma regulatory factor (Ser/Thr protein kinase)